MQDFPGRHSVALSTAKLSLLVSLYLLAVLNGAFWSKGDVVFAGHEAGLSLLAVVLLLLHTAALLLFSNRSVFKPVLTIMIFMAALAAYPVAEFEDSVAMIVLQPGILVTGGFLKHMIIYAVLPSFLLMAIVVERLPARQQFGRTVSNITACLLVATAILYVNYPSYASVFREQRDFTAMLNPVAPVANSIRYLRRFMGGSNVVAVPVRVDADAASLCNQAKSRCMWF
jgi:lipid A ethanolaminephosphotransferase